MGEVVDVASVVRTARQIRGIYPTNAEMISRVAEVLTGGGHVVWVVRLVRETLCMSGLDAWSRAECIRCVENHLCANGVAIPTTIGRVSGEDMLKLASDQKHTDATIDVTGQDKRATKRFHAHTCVLITRSEHFATRIGFGSTGGTGGVLRIEMMDPTVFELVLRFIYTGALVPLRQSAPTVGPDGEERFLAAPCPDVLAGVVLAADMYVVPGLVRECMDFVDPSNALVVMRAAARVDTEETNVLVESCASVLVLHDAERWNDPHVLQELPPRAVYAVAAQMVSSVHRVRRDTLKGVVRGVWEAVRAWYGGGSLVEIQASLVEEGTPAGMLIEPYTGAVDLDWKGTGAVTKTTTTVFGAKYDVELKTAAGSGRRVIVRARDVKYSTVDFTALSMSYLVASSPKLVTVRTGSGASAHAVLGGAHGHIGIAVDDGDTATVEVNPIFSLITAAAALGLDESTDELVGGLHVDVLRCVLRSGYAACDAVRALRAVAGRAENREEVVRALTDKLAPVPVDALLDVLREVPTLGRLDSFTRLLVNRISEAPDLSAEARETGLVGLIRCISAAHVAIRDEPEPEPNRKVARHA